MSDKKDFFNLSAQDTLNELAGRRQGLSIQEAAKRLQQDGPNTLSEGEKKSVIRVFFEQFKDLLVIILLIAAAISAVSKSIESCIVIVAVLILNAILGTVQHFKAEKSLESLKALSAPTAKVIRDGIKTEMAAAEIVKGDIVSLEAGDLVVADGRIIENFSLQVNESSLTGESHSIDKTIDIIEASDLPLGDRKNMVYSGSLVTYGRAYMAVTATAMHTEIGKIAFLMNQTQQRKTPLQISLDNFGKKLAMVIIAICILIFALNMIQNYSFTDALLFAVALAVAAIPEALSAIVTIVLAVGTQKIAKANAIIKELKAVESLGAVSVICSDKTGTLTQNKMVTQQAYVDGILMSSDDLVTQNPQHARLLNAAILASDATVRNGQNIGDPTEVALVNLGHRLGMHEEEHRGKHQRLSELAFDSGRKMMSTLHCINGQYTMYTKGALDVILPLVKHIEIAGIVKEFTADDKREIFNINEKLSQNGLRVLAFAYKTFKNEHMITLEDEQDFTFIGLISLMDPPRLESIESVKAARLAGIKTVMITGDHKTTATAIARQIGIMRDEDIAVDGCELNQMSDEDLSLKIAHIVVYARVSPEHKIRIVDAWQKRGNIVAMTGDGVNDAPALKKADVGVAMGMTGTAVSKDAAAVILADDNFATIVKAVANGRNIYNNIKNSVRFLLSGNFAAILGVLYASVVALPMPFAAVQLLFINLLTDSLPAIAIGMESPRQNLLKDKPRDSKEPILNRYLLTAICVQGLSIGFFVMWAFYIGYAHSATMAMTMAFATLTLARLFHGFNCRGKGSIFKLGILANKYSWMAFGAGVSLLVCALFVPVLQGAFQVEPLNGAQIWQIVALAFAPTFIIQTYKVIRDAITDSRYAKNSLK
ncbi:MAG: cation-translocating P-type ATPase [Chloroflexi bacterium]|nr:cation-translocating P-type ATPase [Chloroflexota bacterium]